MNGIEPIIKSIVDKETEAWNNQDAEALVSLFHPDMVWPWPANNQDHNPELWIFPQGRYNRERWKKGWEEIFRNHKLILNERKIIKITVSREEDGAIAIVDVDTVWQHRTTGEVMHWKGRACKGYTKVDDKWLLIYHTGLLDYKNI
jgi:ketosteroid isomerase-like protein